MTLVSPLADIISIILLPDSHHKYRNAVQILLPG